MVAFDVPNVARMYDYLLGGKDHFTADREAADRLLAIAPDARQAAQDNRAFLGRAVRFLATEAQVGQFIDIGSGLPTGQNVHEVAQRADSFSRVAYVDYDDVVSTHAAALLAGGGSVIAVKGDLRDPQAITGNPAVQELINFSRPVAVTLVAVLHFLPDGHAYPAVEYLKEAMAPGSYLAVSHATTDGAREGVAAQVTDVYKQASAPLFPRSREQVGRFFSGLQLEPPGIVNVREWGGRPEDKEEGRVNCYGGVGKKT